MIGIYLEQKEFDKAIALARTVYDNDRTRENEQQVADVLSWKGDASSLDEAISIYVKLLRESRDEKTEARLAEITLWAKDYSDAVARYQALLDDNRFATNASKYADGYINAAASAPQLTPKRR